MNEKLMPLPIVQYIPTVDAATANSILSAKALTTAEQIIEQDDLDGNVDVYRILSVTGGAVGMGGIVEVYGRDEAGVNVHDFITISGTATVIGTIPFALVRKIIVPVLTTAGDTVSVGVSNKLGLFRTANDVIAVQVMASDDTAFEKTDFTHGDNYVLPSGISAHDSFQVFYTTDQVVVDQEVVD
jgi:hypothetical protein